MAETKQPQLKAVYFSMNAAFQCEDEKGSPVSIPVNVNLNFQDKNSLGKEVKRHEAIKDAVLALMEAMKKSYNPKGEDEATQAGEDFFNSVHK